MQRWNAAPFAAKGSFTLHSERPRIPPADANILVVNEHNLKVVFGTRRAITHPTRMTFYICGKFQNIHMQVFKFIFQSVGDGCSTKIVCQSCSSGRLQPCLGVTLISWAGNIQKHTRRRRLDDYCLSLTLVLTPHSQQWDLHSTQ